MACDAHADRATGSRGGIGKIKVYCVGRIIVAHWPLKLCRVQCFLRLFSITTTCWLIWIHISWLGIWYLGNGLQGPMRTQQGAPAVQLSLPICLWCWPYTPSPGTSLPAREEQQERDMLNLQTSRISTNIDQQTQTITSLSIQAP